MGVRWILMSLSLRRTTMERLANSCEMTYERCPLSVELQVWDQNSYHKDVWCGTATITNITSQGSVEKQEYVLVKRKHDRDEETGKIYVSMKLGYQQQGSL